VTDLLVTFTNTHTEKLQLVIFNKSHAVTRKRRPAFTEELKN